MTTLKIGTQWVLVSAATAIVLKIVFAQLVLRPSPHLFVFKRKRSCFAPFSKRFASTLIVFVSFSAVHTTTPYLFENAVIPSVPMV